MGSPFRKERLNETIKEVLSELIFTRIKDPRVGFVTINSVEISSDQTSAKVYFSVLGDEEERAETKKGLISAKGFLRKEIAKELKLRNSPDLYFVYDDTLDRSMRIEDAIREIREGEEEPRE